MKKFTFFLSLLCLICIGATAQSFTPAQDKAYTVKTADRGWYTSNGTNIVGTDNAEAASHFAFIECYSKTFMYSVTDKKFIGRKTDDKAYLLDGDLSKVAEITIHESGNEDNPFYLTNQNNLYFNMTGNKNVLIDSWTTLDAGNMLAIAEAADFSAEDLAEAKSKLKSYFTSLYDNARNEIPALIQKAQLSTYFTKSAEEIQKLQQALDDNVASSEEEHGQAAVNLENAIDAFKASANINTDLPNGKYLLINVGRGDAVKTPHYLSINLNKKLMNTTCTTRSVWNLTKGDNGYTIQNVLTGDYIQQQPTTSAQFSLGSDPAAFILTPNNGNNFGAAIGGEDRYSKLHEGTGGQIVAWETAATATWWYFIPYTEDMAASLAAAETNLFNQEKAPYITSVTNLPAIFGVSTNEAVAAALSDLENSTLPTLFNSYNQFYSVLGTAISTHYYRIQNVKNQTYFSLREGNNGESWCAAGNSSDINQIWQIVGANGGFKFKNVNTGKFLADIRGGGTTTTPLEDAGAVYAINDKDGSVEIITGGKPVQCEPSGYLNWWYESGQGNARWNITEATDITVDMNTVNGESWASLYLPFGVQLADGVEAYYTANMGMDESETSYILQMEKTNAVPANTGVVLKGTGNSYTLTIDNEVAELEGENMLTGTNVDYTFTDQMGMDGYWGSLGYMVWTLGCLNDQVGFYYPKFTEGTQEVDGTIFETRTVTLKANKAYFLMDNSAGGMNTAKYFTLSFGKGENTGIQNTVAGQDEKDNIFFDLSGRRVQAPAKGIYVTGNGKKIYVK